MSTAPYLQSPAATASHTEARLRIGGDWTLAHYAQLLPQVDALRSQLDVEVRVDLSGLGALDTAGAALLVELLGAGRLAELAADAPDLSRERRALLQTIGQAMADNEAPAQAKSGTALGDVFAHIGEATLTIWQHLVALLGFIGLTLSTLVSVLLRPKRWRLTALAAHLEQTGLNAVPIVALLTFLVGAVVAFLGATVLADFGASIYTVDLVAFSFLREFGVLLTAILMAGRTASAFTAQIGSMKANEEIDAIRTLGLSPIELLVLPRVFALLLALPMLTFVAMLSGIFGGAVVCALTLDIPLVRFLAILQEDIGLNHFLVGMLKAPIFAFLIAVIGCLEGFKVSGSAQSVGEHTTSAVVQSIFVVILLDAIAALFLMEMGW
ncbi:MAG: MlaE family lipid ABC transporter permease subunit [Gammaproteobacteria bacterium]|nr:MlaE family lipid ABC transporter permease subunit [Gammaproteobacteria bacterium]MBU1491968.1 MlaE family lipid ABC transporter permease subunit [Gammaproteobacteria bacterium]MBU2065781.1 MlaE family lipid ABC transporter permease subunit [Gammaproteobacteria bacterium]MBU2140570.1 MlaE family lipid ABC transporter permease subunit [Gammaproteobacteria bacterium]MBU2215863.1 MlaE family lipid ABC transporter permease subunit [Gammaproteobacteria bacterium]